MLENTRAYLSPAGGGLALLCFFLPWVSCAGRPISGADAGGLLWLAFLSALGILGAYFHFSSRQAVHQARKPILVCASTGITITSLWYLAVLNGEYSEMISIRLGGVLTLVGFGLAIYGARHLSATIGTPLGTQAQKRAPPPPPQGG